MYKNKDILKKNINLAIEGIKIELANKEYIISHLKGSKIGSSIEIVKLKHVSITSALVTWLKSDCKLDEEQFIMFISSLSKI